MIPKVSTASTSILMQKIVFPSLSLSVRRCPFHEDPIFSRSDGKQQKRKPKLSSHAIVRCTSGLEIEGILTCSNDGPTFKEEDVVGERKVFLLSQ